MDRRIWLATAIVTKALVIGLTALGAFGGLERFEEKGFGWRLLWYPLAVLALPVIWTALFRTTRYPYAADVLLTLPFLIDVLGNVVDFYDKISWWDDVNHFANWLFLALGFGVLLLRTRLDRFVHAGLIVGFGATLAILWEIGEYWMFLRTNEEELPTAYTDTVADMAFGLLGSVLAAAILLAVDYRGRRAAAATGPTAQRPAAIPGA